MEGDGTGIGRGAAKGNGGVGHGIRGVQGEGRPEDAVVRTQNGNRNAGGGV